MPEITVRGRRLAYAAQPSAFDPTALSVLFIHGTAGDQEDWRAQLDGLSGQVNTMAISLPGHGASEGPGESTVSEYSRWVEDFVEALGLKRVVVVGCSLGSAVTLWLALHPAPWLVGIGLVGSGGRLRVHPAFVEGVLQDKDKAVHLLTDYALAGNPDPQMRALVIEKFLNSTAQVINGDLVACDTFDVMKRLGEISVPVTIIVGEEDKLTPPKYSQFLHNALPGSRLTVVPGAGHLVMMEQRDRFNAALVEFLSTLA
jgi:pimeloyl-ACP methyl ester carboxylesterase